MLALSVLSLAAVAIAAPVRFVAVVVAPNATYTNATQYNGAEWYTQQGRAGACGLYSRDLDNVVGLGLEWYNNTSVVSPYCGSYITVTNPLNNMTVTARVADASGSKDMLSMSVASWRAIEGDQTSMQNVTWVFANNTEIEAAVAHANQMAVFAEVPSGDSSAAFVAATSSFIAPTATYIAPTSTYVAPTSTYVAPTSTYVAPTSTYVAPSSTYTPYVAPSSTYVAPTSTYTPYVAPKATQASSGSYSGDATYFYQNGNPGACGNYNSDSTYLVAIDSAMYNGGSNCGRQVRITRTSTGQSITAIVADECPTCNTGTSLDLSVGAFNALASESTGLFEMTWSFV